MNLKTYCFLLFTGAPALAGASAPIDHTSPVDSLEVTGSLTDLVRTICSVPSPEPHREKRPVLTQHGRLVIFPGDSIPEIDSIMPVEESSDDDKIGLSALDFLSTVYEEADYYDSGYYGKPEPPVEQIIYTGPLPTTDLADICRPIKGRITSGFGYREQYHRYHKGIDIGLCVGDTIRAALPGRVARVGYERGGYGHFVIISHSNGIETRFAHLQKALVEPGQELVIGAPIALGGNSGNSTGPHLHFEIRLYGRAIDPQRVLDFTSD